MNVMLTEIPFENYLYCNCSKNKTMYSKLSDEVFRKASLLLIKTDVNSRQLTKKATDDLAEL
jgi:hypothetical protein